MGQTIDFLLTSSQDPDAASRFFRKALPHMENRRHCCNVIRTLKPSVKVAAKDRRPG